MTLLIGKDTASIIVIIVFISGTVEVLLLARRRLAVPVLQRAYQVEATGFFLLLAENFKRGHRERTGRSPPRECAAGAAARGARAQGGASPAGEQT